jgi:hypothetical protein
MDKKLYETNLKIDHEKKLKSNGQFIFYYDFTGWY